MKLLLFLMFLACCNLGKTLPAGGPGSAAKSTDWGDLSPSEKGDYVYKVHKMNYLNSDTRNMNINDLRQFKHDSTLFPNINDEDFLKLFYTIDITKNGLIYPGELSDYLENNSK